MQDDIMLLKFTISCIKHMDLSQRVKEKRQSCGKFREGHVHGEETNGRVSIQTDNLSEGVNVKVIFP